MQKSSLTFTCRGEGEAETTDPVQLLSLSAHEALLSSILEMERHSIRHHQALYAYSFIVNVEN